MGVKQHHRIPQPPALWHAVKLLADRQRQYFFYSATNLRKKFKAVNYTRGIDSLVFVDSGEGFGLRRVQHIQPHFLF